MELIDVKRGRTESVIPVGRLDIDFDLLGGLVVVECKITPLADADVRQLCRYLDDLQERSIAVYRAHLVGRPPSSHLDPQLLKHPPGIRLKLLFRDIPANLAFCEGRHYFDAFAEKCPYCGEQPIPGKELMLQF